MHFNINTIIICSLFLETTELSFATPRLKTTSRLQTPKKDINNCPIPQQLKKEKSC